MKPSRPQAAAECAGFITPMLNGKRSGEQCSASRALSLPAVMRDVSRNVAVMWQSDRKRDKAARKCSLDWNLKILSTNLEKKKNSAGGLS